MKVTFVFPNRNVQKDLLLLSHNVLVVWSFSRLF